MTRPLTDAPYRGYRIKRRRGPEGYDAPPTRRRNPPARSTAGLYTGMFKFPNKRAKKDKSRTAFNGSQGHFEDNVDAMTGANVAYFGLSSVIKGTSGGWYVVNPVYHCVVGILRKMFKKYYEVDIESTNQSLSDLIFTAFPTGIRMYYKKTPQSNGATGSTVAPTINYDSTHDVIFGSTPVYGWAYSLTSNILGKKEYGARNESFATDAYQLYGFAFLTLGGGGTNVAASGIYRLDSQKVSVMSTTTVYVQNQTNNDTGNTSYTVVDANPIKGRIFYFNDPNPICQYAQITTTRETWRQWKLMNDSNGDGLIYPDADVSAMTGESSPWTQLPSTDMFTNCKKYSSAGLAPGEIKKLILRFKFNGYLTKLLQGLAVNTDIVSSNQYQGTVGQYGNLGTSLLFAFDKRIASGTGNVELSIQRNVVCSVNIGHRTMRAMQPIKRAEVAALPDDTT